MHQLPHDAGQTSWSMVCSPWLLLLAEEANSARMLLEGMFAILICTYSHKLDENIAVSLPFKNR